MGFIHNEGKFNDNAFLVDGLLWGVPNALSLYVIEHNGMRLLIDTGEESVARRIVSKLKKMNLLPIHKILLTHSHWDHVAGVKKITSMMDDTPIEVFASEKAIDNLKHPEKMNSIYGQQVNVVDNVTPLKQGDTIDLNGLKLDVVNLFGHTQDSIGILDKKNKILFAGDAIVDYYEPNTMCPTFFPPDFIQQELFKTYQKVRTLPIDALALDHFGVWHGEDYHKIMVEVEPLHTETKAALIGWAQKKLTIDEITRNFHEKFLSHSIIHQKEHLEFLKPTIQWYLQGLKLI